MGRARRSETPGLWRSSTTSRIKSRRPGRLPERIDGRRRDRGRVLGIDPGLVATGYAVIETASGGVQVLDQGVIETSSEAALDERIHLIYDAVSGLIDKHAPTALALEDLYAAYDFPRTALLMAHARGVVCLAARQRDVCLVMLAPAEVKRAVTGNGAAGKIQVERSVQRLLALAASPRPSHIADALAIAFTALSRIGGVR